LAVLADLLGLALFAATFLNGQWLVYRLREYVAEGLRLSLSVFGGFFRLFMNPEAGSGNEAPTNAGRSSLKLIKPYLVGLLIAIPVLIFFGWIFTSADLVFAQKSRDLFAWFRSENMADLLQPFAIGLLIAYLSFGIMAFAFTRGASRRAISPENRLFEPFLGTTESLVVLVLLNSLFGAFLLVQVRYFFGGGQNIHIDGFTYAEYARKGWFELLAVAFFTGILHWGLSAVTRKTDRKKKLRFAAAVSLLYLQVGVVMLSAFQRMQLYIQAYGFSQNRLLAQIFMAVLAFILLALLLMEWRDRFDRLALVLSLSLFLFAFLAAGINVDAYVARKNLSLAKSNGKMDVSFMIGNLSTSAVPALFEAYDEQTFAPELKETLGKVLACKAARFGPRLDTAQPWFATKPADRRAKALFESHRLELAKYIFESRESGAGILFPEGFVFCEYLYN